MREDKLDMLLLRIIIPTLMVFPASAILIGLGCGFAHYWLGVKGLSIHTVEPWAVKWLTLAVPSVFFTQLTRNWKELRA